METGVRRFGRAALVVNSGSRSGAEAFDTARDRLTELGLPLAHCYPVTDAARLPEVIDDVLADGCDLVVLGGGDGTMSAVVDQLAQSGVTLGVLALGTANDFARTLQIPTDVVEACDAIAHGKVVDIDLGVVGRNPDRGRHFVNVASVGLSVGVTRALSPVLKKRLGPLAYPVATMRAYREHRPFTAYLEFPDGDHATLRLDDLLQVAVGNGRHYGGGNVVSPDAGIDDHSLDVYAIRRGRMRDHVSIARVLRDGSFVEHDNVTHVTTRRVRLRTDPEQQVNVDGEVVASTPQEFSVDRNALDVLVPHASTGARQDAARPPAKAVQELDT